MTDSSRINLTPEQQAAADNLIEALGKRAFLASHPALSHLVALWEENGNQELNKCICDDANYVFAPTLPELVEHAAWHFDGPEDLESIVPVIRQQAELALVGAVEFWGEDGHFGPILATITHTDGRSRVLVLQIIDFAQGPYDWKGAFASADAVKQWLVHQGHITGIEQFDAMPGDSLLNEWAQHY